MIKLKGGILAASSVKELINYVLDEMDDTKSSAMNAIEYLDLFFEASKWGTKGMITISMAREVLDTGKPLRFPTDKELLDWGLFCAYMMVSQHRRMAVDKSCKMVDFMQDALELFALGEGRPFSNLMAVEKLIKSKDEFDTRKAARPT